MAKYIADARHVDRRQQVDQTHTHTKALHDAAVEAVKYHDKYMNAMEKVMSCLLDNSDCMEDMRKDLEGGGEEIAPKYEVTGAVVGAFTNFKSSLQVKALRECLSKLADVSTTAKRQSKIMLSAMENFNAAAKKSAKRDTQEMRQKLAQATGKKKEKMVQEQQAEATELSKLNAAVVESTRSLCAWWAGKLAGEAEELYTVHHHVGLHITRCYEATAQLSAPPPSAIPQQGVGAYANPQNGAASMRASHPRDDTSSYVGVSDYLSLPASQLPPTKVSGYQGSPGRVSRRSSSPPPPLYASVHKTAAPTASAPPGDSLSDN